MGAEGVVTTPFLELSIAIYCYYCIGVARREKGDLKK